MVDEYRDWRTRWLEARENGDNMRMEDDEYREHYPPPTFKQWLIGRKQDRERET